MIFTNFKIREIFFRKMQDCSWDSNIMLNVLVALKRSKKVHYMIQMIEILRARQRERKRSRFFSISVHRHFFIWRTL